MTIQQQELIDEVVNELRPVVQKIENGMRTTKDLYGEYMSLLASYPVDQRKIIAILLIKAGANIEGVKWALKLS